MKYIAPQIIEVTPATRVIHGSVEDKGRQTFLDSLTGQNDATIGAYEADE